MKKFRDFLSRPAVTATLLALALVLLSGSTLGGARAALNIQSRDYQARVNVSNINVELLENGVPKKGSDALLQDLLTRHGDDKLLAGKKYSEKLSVKNTGTVNEYVRVSVYKYWLDSNGEKTPDLDSKWIELGFVTNNGWSIDDESTTEERTVLYYAPLLESGQESNPFLESITIDEDTVKQVKKDERQEGNVTIIEWTYLYNDYKFCISVYVDGVQNHHMEEAKVSAWGVNK